MMIDRRKFIFSTVAASSALTVLPNTGLAAKAQIYQSSAVRAMIWAERNYEHVTVYAPIDGVGIQLHGRQIISVRCIE